MSKDFFKKKVVLEASIEDQVCAWAENNGFIVRKLKYLGRNGAPDRFIAGYGKIHLLELKRPGDGKLSENQVREHERLEAVGVHVHVFCTSDSAIDFLRSQM